MSLGSIIRKLRKENGINRKQLADSLGITYHALAKYETDDREPDYNTLKKFADYFNVPLDYLLGLTNDPTPYSNAVPQGTGKLKESGHDHLEGSKNLPLVEVKKIPIYSLKPKSREMFFAPDNIIGYEPVPADTMANFAVKIDDDSMSGSRINKGDRAIIPEQTTFADGQAVLAVIPDGTFTIRKAKRTNDGVILYPENNNYQPEHFTEDELQIIGIVVKVIFDYI